jgi:HAD superfamily hydrolase (TIGR01509 family)
VVVVFDLMETLLTDPYRAAHEAATGLDFEELHRLRPPEVYHRLERGEIEEETYWASLRDAGIGVDEEVFHEVRRNGYQWLDGMRELVQECAAVHRTVVGSNYPDWIVEVAAEFLGDLRIDVVASCQLGVRKPSVRFFEEICERFAAPPQELVLIDDKKANTEAVARLGGLGIRFVSAAETRRQLTRACVLAG